MDFEEGIGVVDCVLDEVPLASGTYAIGAGLAIPNAEWLCWTQDICELDVLPKDIYGSGLAPVSSRCLMAVRHKWEIPS